MPRPSLTRIALISALSLSLSGALLLQAPQAYAQGNKGQSASAQSGKITGQQAAAKAKSRHGGKVLKVTPDKKGYKVKLLQDSGRVITVRVDS